MENKNIDILINTTWKYRLITITCCLVVAILFCTIIINYAVLKNRVDIIAEHISIIEKDNKDLNFEIGKAQGMADQSK